MVDPERLREELRAMRKLIEKDPEVKAQFDTDGSGHIDGEEWEQVRQLVIQRLEREAAEADAAGRLAERTGATGVFEASIPGAIAQRIFEGDLAAARDGHAVRGGLLECSEMILEQQGGLGQLFEGLVRRTYAVLAPDGGVLGSLEQVENEMLQELQRRSFLDAVELSFTLCDATTGDRWTLRRSEGLGSDRITLFDASERQIGHVSWDPGIFSSKVHVASSFEPGMLVVKSSIFRPFRLEIRGIVGNTIGSIERGWSGLGSFLTGGNRMRIVLDEPGQASATHRIGLLAAALVADLRAEDDD